MINTKNKLGSKQENGAIHWIEIRQIEKWYYARSLKPDNIWSIRLTFSKANDEELEKLTTYMRQEFQNLESRLKRLNKPLKFSQKALEIVEAHIYPKMIHV